MTVIVTPTDAQLLYIEHLCERLFGVSSGDGEHDE